MTRLLILLLLCLPIHVAGQTLYSGESIYDPAGGLFELDSLRSIHIDFYDDDYHDILVDGWFEESGLRLPARISLSNGIELDSVAIRYKGNSTFVVAEQQNNPKLPLNIDINDLVSEQKLMGYKKLKLANAFFDPTFVREVTGYLAYRRYIPSPQANLLKVYCEDEYLGLYVNTESVGKQFLKKHFGDSDGILFKCDPAVPYGQGADPGSSNLTWLGNDSSSYYNHYQLRSDHGWTELVELIYLANHNPEELHTILNVDRVLWAFAVNQVFVNLDTYNGVYQHNYYLYKTRDGRFQMIPWDISECFVGALLTQYSNINAFHHHDPFDGQFSSWTPLVSQLTADPQSLYGKIYAAHLRTIIDESLKPGPIDEFIDQLQDRCETAVEQDANKWFNMFQYRNNVDENLHSWGLSVGGINNTIERRLEYLSEHPEIQHEPPQIYEVREMMVEQSVVVEVETSGATMAELLVATEANSVFAPHQMLDDGSNGDQIAGDQIYSLVLPHQFDGQQIRYYIRLHNESALVLSPERAEFDFYTFGQATAIPDKEPEIGLQTYPNPSIDVVHFEFDLPVVAEVSLNIFDSAGRVVITILTKQSLQGKQLFTWETNDQAAGAYNYQFDVDGHAYRGILIVEN